MSQRPLTFIIPILPALSSVSGGQSRPPLQMSGPKPPSVREVSWPSAMTEGETQYALSLPQSASPTAPSQRGPRKRSPAGQKSSFRGAQIPCKCPCGACENRLISPPRPAEFTLYHSNLLQQFIISRKICRHARFFPFQTLSANRLKSCEIFQN